MTLVRSNLTEPGTKKTYRRFVDLKCTSHCSLYLIPVLRYTVEPSIVQFFCFFFGMNPVYYSSRRSLMLHFPSRFCYSSGPNANYATASLTACRILVGPAPSDCSPRGSKSVGLFMAYSMRDQIWYKFWPCCIQWVAHSFFSSPGFPCCPKVG